jgi:hypothetical protein
MNKGNTVYFYVYFSCLVLLLCVFSLRHCNAQGTPQKTFTRDSLPSYKFTKNKYFIHCTDSLPILIALSFYPELSNTRVKFMRKKARSPLSTRQSVFNVFRKKSRRIYIITISTKTNKRIAPILLDSLGFNAQIGVLGHELSHVSAFAKMSAWQYAKFLLSQIKKTSIDAAENQTDKRTIDHGLGYQLLDWSKEVRAKLNILRWGGSEIVSSKKERYMNPESIIDYMKNTHKEIAPE